MAISAPPTLLLSFSPSGPEYPISEQCAMPSITATATFKGLAVDPKNPVQYEWTVSLVFPGSTTCVHSVGRSTSHNPIHSTTSTNSFKIPFTQVRGGDLTVKVTARAGAMVASAQSSGLKVAGTNPSIGSLQITVPAKAAFRKLMRLESGLKQFLSGGCPKFSEDNKGGVGLCQLTSPAPTADQIWSWKENLKGGIVLWNSKEAIAKGYPAQVRSGSQFLGLIKAYNAQLAATALAAAKAANKPPPAFTPVAVTLSDFTDEQLQRDTLRGFNGWAAGLHEYRVKVDANGLLVVEQGAAQWEAVTADARREYYKSAGLAKEHWGDPNYVDDVERQATF